MRLILPLLALSVMSSAQNYTARTMPVQGVTVIRLEDHAKGVEVNVVPAIGNRVIDMKIHGNNILYPATTDLAELKQKPGLGGVPFLAPWANRLGEESFWANGKKYSFNMALGNVRGPIPIHGLLTSSDLWEVTEFAADRKSAHVTSRLQFWKHPELMAQWPFAHEYEMTYRLTEGILEVKLTVTNLGSEPMPVSVGFHPYYRIPDVPRDQWTTHIPARKIVVADSRLVATGEYKAFDLGKAYPLKGNTLDDGFVDLERDAQGRALFSIESGGKKVEVLFGPKYIASQVYAPPPLNGQPREFICFEPMAGITNAVNLNHDGKYAELQSVAPGAKWTESFWIRASGFLVARLY